MYELSEQTKIMKQYDQRCFDEALKNIERRNFEKHQKKKINSTNCPREDWSIPTIDVICDRRML